MNISITQKDQFEMSYYSVYLNWRDSGLGEEPRALAFIPSLGQPLGDFGLVADEVVPD